MLRLLETKTRLALDMNVGKYIFLISPFASVAFCFESLAFCSPKEEYEEEMKETKEMKKEILTQKFDKAVNDPNSNSPVSHAIEITNAASSGYNPYTLFKGVVTMFDSGADMNNPDKSGQDFSHKAYRQQSTSVILSKIDNVSNEWKADNPSLYREDINASSQIKKTLITDEMEQESRDRFKKL